MQQQFAVRPSRGAILVVSALFASAPAALAGSSAWPLEAAPVLVLGASADTVQTEDEVSFDILAPAPAVMPTVTAPAAALAQSGYDDNASGMFFRLGGGLMTATESDGPDEDIEFDEGYIVDLAIGHRFAGNPNSLGFDLELEGVWTDQDTDDDDVVQAVRDVTVLAALVNGIADFRLANSFSIYGGAGIGAAFMDIGTESDALNDFDDEDGPFLAWQGKAGLKFLTAGGNAIGFGYRFLNIDDVEIDDDVGGSSFDLQTQQHALELSYTFGVAAGY